MSEAEVLIKECGEICNDVLKPIEKLAELGGPLQEVQQDLTRVSADLSKEPCSCRKLSDEVDRIYKHWSRYKSEKERKKRKSGDSLTVSAVEFERQLRSSRFPLIAEDFGKLIGESGRAAKEEDELCESIAILALIKKPLDNLSKELSQMSSAARKFEEQGDGGKTHRMNMKTGWIRGNIQSAYHVVQQVHSRVKHRQISSNSVVERALHHVLNAIDYFFLSMIYKIGTLKELVDRKPGALRLFEIGEASVMLRECQEKCNGVLHAVTDLEALINSRPELPKGLSRVSAKILEVACRSKDGLDLKSPTEEQRPVLLLLCNIDYLFLSLMFRAKTLKYMGIRSQLTAPQFQRSKSAEELMTDILKSLELYCANPTVLNFESFVGEVFELFTRYPTFQPQQIDAEEHKKFFDGLKVAVVNFDDCLDDLLSHTGDGDLIRLRTVRSGLEFLHSKFILNDTDLNSMYSATLLKGRNFASLCEFLSGFANVLDTDYDRMFVPNLEHVPSDHDWWSRTERRDSQFNQKDYLLFRVTE